MDEEKGHGKDRKTKWEICKFYQILAVKSNDSLIIPFPKKVYALRKFY